MHRASRIFIYVYSWLSFIILVAYSGLFIMLGQVFVDVSQPSEQGGLVQIVLEMMGSATFFGADEGLGPIIADFFYLIAAGLVILTLLTLVSTILLHKHKRLGLIIAIILQVIQIPLFKISDQAYFICYPIYFYIAKFKGHVYTLFDALFQFTFFPDPESALPLYKATWGINFVPFVIILLLLYGWHRQKRAEHSVNFY